jgi:HEAT repeat protein
MASFEDRIDARKKQHKKGVDAEEARRKREDEAVQLRKNKKEELLQKRRNHGEENAATTGVIGALDAGIAEAAPTNENAVVQQLAAALDQHDQQVVVDTTRDIRKRLSVTTNPPIQACIDAGVIPKMVNFCRNGTSELQFEAAWVLTNIASGVSEQTMAVVHAGAVPVLVGLLTSPAAEVREQATWALGNVAGDCSQLRNMCLQAGMIVPLLQILTDPQCPKSMMRNATWSVSNLFRGKPPPPFELVIQALPIVSQLIYSTDAEVATDATWALSYISDGSSQQIGAVIQTGCVPKLVQMLGQEELVQPALRALGNIVTGTDEQTEVALQAGCLEPMQLLATNPKKIIRKETMWMLSNITAGNNRQIAQVIDKQLIPRAMELLASGDWDVKKEATWVLANAVVGGTPEQVMYLVQQGAVQGLCGVLEVNDSGVVETVLDSLEAILKVGKSHPDERTLQHLCNLVEQCDGLTKLESLQDDANEGIYNRAVRILQTYFGAEEEDGLGQDVPAVQPLPQGGFNFAAPPATGAGGYPMQ